MSDESYDKEEYFLATIVNEQVNPNLTERIHWENTDNCITKTYDTYATSQYSANYNASTKKTVYNRPYTITGHQFNLNIPSNAYVKNLRFIAHMKADTGLLANKPYANFNMYGKASSSKYDNTKTTGTGWNNGYYRVYASTDLTDKWRGLHYTMTEEDIIKGGFTTSAFNDGVMGVDLVFNDNARNKVSSNATWNVYLAYIEVRVRYDLPKPNITYSSNQKGEDIKVNQNYTVTATYTNPSKANDGTQVIDVELPLGAELVSYHCNQGAFNSSTMKWTIDTSDEAVLTLTLNPQVSGDNTLVLSNDAIGTYPHSFNVNRDVTYDGGAIKMELSTSPNPHKNHRMCIYVDSIGQSESSTVQYVFSSPQTTSDGVWELETGSTGVSVASNSGESITLNVPQYQRFTAKLKYCFYPKTTGRNVGVVNTFDTEYNVANPYTYIISSNPSMNENEAYLTGQSVKIVDHRVASEVGVDSSYLASNVVEEDSLMTQNECSLKMYMQEELDYIGCVPLEQTHFDPKSTFKDTLLDTHYKNKRYMGKKLATDENITLNVRLHPRQVTTVQGLVEMDKPIPINANHRCFESDALNHRGWAEIYGIQAEQTGNNPHWYKCDIDVKYLTHNLNTRFNIEKGIKVATYEYPSLLAESVGSGTSLADGYFIVDTDGSFVYNDDDEIQDNIRNILSISNNQYFTIKSKDILSSQSVVAFEWLSTLLGEYKENNVNRIIRLIDADTNNPIFEYEYTDFEYNDDFINCSLIARRWDGVGWDSSTQSDVALWRDDSILDDEVDESDNEILFGSTSLLKITNNHLEIIESGFNGRETSQSFELTGSGKYYYEIDVVNRNIDAETGAVDFYIDLTVMDTILTSNYADKYSKLYVSPFPVADKSIIFTREAEEGTLYYLEDDGEEFTFLINPYYQYKNGTDLIYDGISIFDLNYGYDIVYIQNGLVRMGFNRLNGRLYLGKYDPVSREYINTHRFHLEKYDDINVNSISDDKIEIQASDSVFTIYRGHPYIMIRHNNEDIWIDTSFNMVWAEKIGGDDPVSLPSYWDLMNNSNILPSSVGGRKGIKASDVTVEEVEVDTRGSSSTTISSISDGTNSYDSFSNVPFEVGVDYIFTLNGTIDEIGDEIPVNLGNHQGSLGKYSLSTDSSASQTYDVTLSSSRSIIQLTDEITDMLQAFVSNYDGKGINNKSVSFLQYNPLLFKYTGLTSTSSTDDSWAIDWTSGTDAVLNVGSTYSRFRSISGSRYIWGDVSGTTSSTFDFYPNRLSIEFDTIDIYPNTTGTARLVVTTTGYGTSSYQTFIKVLPDGEHHIKAVLDGGVFNYYVDDVLIDTTQFSTNLILRVGLNVYEGSYIDFKNFKIGGF